MWITIYGSLQTPRSALANYSFWSRNCWNFAIKKYRMALAGWSAGSGRFHQIMEWTAKFLRWRPSSLALTTLWILNPLKCFRSVFRSVCDIPVRLHTLVWCFEAAISFSFESIRCIVLRLLFFAKWIGGPEVQWYTFLLCILFPSKIQWFCWFVLYQFLS